MLDQLITAVDLYPTILQLAGIDYRTVQPAGVKVDGVSLFPLLDGTDPAPVHDYIDSDLATDPLETRNILSRPLKPAAAKALAELRDDLAALLATR